MRAEDNESRRKLARSESSSMSEKKVIRRTPACRHDLSSSCLTDNKLLFPGDAQIENWAYALSEPTDLHGMKKLLADVDLYKVGNHGSRNATPRTLWDGFKHKSAKSATRGGSRASSQR
jgi:hypothetical protein